jgi:hypothetical protein
MNEPKKRIDLPKSDEELLDFQRRQKEKAQREAEIAAKQAELAALDLGLRIDASSNAVQYGWLTEPSYAANSR